MWLFILQGLSPLVQRMLEWQELDAVEAVWITVQVPHAALHDRTHSDLVARGMVVERDRQLN